MNVCNLILHKICTSHTTCQNRSATYVWYCKKVYCSFKLPALLKHFLFGLSDPQPLSSSVPQITADMLGIAVYLRCAFDDSSGNSSLGFIVTWRRLSPEGNREELRKDTTIESFALIELDGINLRLGDRVTTIFIIHIYCIFMSCHLYIVVSDLLQRGQFFSGLSRCTKSSRGERRVLCGDSSSFLHL